MLGVNVNKNYEWLQKLFFALPSLLLQHTQSPYEIKGLDFSWYNIVIVRPVDVFQTGMQKMEMIVIFN